jgi:hypothetical protein
MREEAKRVLSCFPSKSRELPVFRHKAGDYPHLDWDGAAGSLSPVSATLGRRVASAS